MSNTFDNFEKSFDLAQQEFDGQIDTSDRSKLVLPENQEAALDFFQESTPNLGKFYPVNISPELLRDNPSLLVNRALLMYNSKLKNLSPVIFTKHPNSPGKFQITMFDLPYDPKVGFTPGMHWMLSLKAQSRAPGFGEHGDKASGLEQGHFSAAILGAYDQAIGQTIINRGDRGTHKVVLDAGVPEVMSKRSMLPVELITYDLDLLEPYFTTIKAYWHDKLQDDRGPLGGDFPEATRLMLGASLHVIGKDGTIKLKGFVNEAVRGA